MKPNSRLPVRCRRRVHQWAASALLIPLLASGASAAAASSQETTASFSGASLLDLGSLIDIDPDKLKDAPPTISLPGNDGDDVSATPMPLPPPADPGAWDQCPGTPKGARELGQGCSAVDIVANPGAILAWPKERLEHLIAGVEFYQDKGEFKSALKEASLASDMVEKATRQLARGSLCGASRSYAAVADHIGTARSRMRAVSKKYAKELAERRHTLPTGDVTPEEMGLAILDLNRTIAGEIFDDVLEPQKTLKAACKSVAGRMSKRGLVIAVDAANRTFQLEDGTVIAMTERPKGTKVYEGQRARFKGVKLDDGSAILVQASDLGKKTHPDPSSFSCMSLRIVPIQEPPDPGVSWELHDPVAYEDNQGRLRLEHGTRFAAVQNCKPKKSSGTQYSMKLVVRVAGKKRTIAYSLKEGARPVYLPLEMQSGLGTYPATLDATVQMRTCTYKWNSALKKSFKKCDQPTDVSTTTYSLRAAPDGSYATAVYDNTEFGPADDGIPGNWEPAMVVGIELNGVAASTNPVFRAKGHKIFGNSPSLTYVPVGSYEPFAIHEFETGSGLIWPRIQGKRGGKKFWYSASLPFIQTDKIADCRPTMGFVLPANPGGAPASDFNVQGLGNTYYELPFVNGAQPSTGFMNIDDPISRHGEGQEYAIDLFRPEGDLLVASRSGRVILLEEDDPYNEKDAPEKWPGIGNYLWLQHRDGTVGVYLHIQYKQVWPKYGEWVPRGHAMGRVGNTGRSSGPHTHFEVITVKLEADGTHSPTGKIRPRYDADVDGERNPCYIPRAGETFSSNQ